MPKNESAKIAPTKDSLKCSDTNTYVTKTTNYNEID